MPLDHHHRNLKNNCNVPGKPFYSTRNTHNDRQDGLANQRQYPLLNENKSGVPPNVRKQINNITKDLRTGERLIRSDRPQHENKILPHRIKLKVPPKRTEGDQSQQHFPVSMKAATTRTGRPDSCLAYDYSFEFDDHNLHDDIMSRKSSLSLLEQKKLQWAQEREELNGLWSPWGRPTDTLSTSMNSSSASIVSPGYASKLGLNTTQSEYHLPPISSTIVQQPRKSSLWSTDENGSHGLFIGANNQQPGNGSNENLSRKSSLPICISTSAGELHFNGSNTVELKHHNAMIMSNSVHSNNNGWASFDEDTITSGYQSENNGFLSNGDGEYSRNGSGDYHSAHSVGRADQEQDYELESRGYLPRRSLKSGNKQACRSRSEGGTKMNDKNDSPTRGKNCDSKKKSNSRKIVVHKILTENESRQEYEYMINAMTEIHRDSLSGRSSYLYNSRSHPNLSNSGRVINAPPPAMRSSITFGIDASHVTDYKEIEKQEREQWLNELEKQREEQRLRREMEREDRERPRWGDKGIGVGHFWEPAVSENARLPPPGSSRGDEDPSAQSTPAWLEKSLHRMETSKSPASLHEMDRGYSQDRSPSPNNNNQLSPNQSAIDLRNVVGFTDSNDPNSERTFLRGQNVPCDPDVYAEKEKKRQAALEHQEAIRKQMEERQLKLKQEREKKIMEEKNEEERMARQQQLELERLEAERRKTARNKENTDESNAFENTYNEGAEPPRRNSQADRRNSRDDFAQSKSKPIMRSIDDNTGRELAMRQSMTLPTLGQSQSMGNITEEVSEEMTSDEFVHRVLASRHDQSIMTELEDLSEVRTLTPTLQRSRSLITAKEFGTQTEGSESHSSSEKSSAKHRSHNCLTEKGKEKEGKKKKKNEKPRWGENPVKKQYLKQSEKDPVYQQRIRKRMDRMKRREEEISIMGDTGTESEEFNIPVNRQIRIRKNESPPRPVVPMRAKVPVKNFNKNSNCKEKSSRESNNKTKQSQSDIFKNPAQNKNNRGVSGGRPLGRHTLPTTSTLTSEESSGFSSPAAAAIRNRDIGAGDSLDFDDYRYLGSAIHEQLPDINSKGSYVSEYMGEIPGTYTKTAVEVPGTYTKKAKKIPTVDVLPNKASKAPVTKGKGDEKSPRKSKPGVSNQNRNPPSNTMQYDRSPTRNPPISMLSQDSILRSFEINTLNSLDLLDEDNQSPYERKQSVVRNPSIDEDSYDKSPYERRQSVVRNPPIDEDSYDRSPYERRQSVVRNPPISMINDASMSTSFDHRVSSPPLPAYEKRQSVVRNPPISMITDSSMSTSFDHRISSPPVPALLKRMQMGFNPDEYGRMSSLQNEMEGSPTGSRAGSRISTSGPRIDIDIAVTPRPEFKHTIFEQSEETESNNTKEDNDTGTRDSSKSLESQDSNNGIEFYDVPHGSFDVVVGVDPKESGRSNLSYRNIDRPLTNASSTDLSRQERFIYSVMSNDDVQAQLSARESELSEKGIIEFSVRLPSQTHTVYRHDMPGHKGSKERMGMTKKHSIESSLDDEYQDPLLTARSNCVRWLYSSDDSPKESVLTHLSYLKKGIMMQQQEWGVVPSDTEEEVYESRR